MQSLHSGQNKNAVNLVHNKSLPITLTFIVYTQDKPEGLSYPEYRIMRLRAKKIKAQPINY